MNSLGAWDSAWRQGLRAARQNLVAGAAVWIVGALIVSSYYAWPAARRVWDAFSAWRIAQGLVYPLVATSLFGGVFPLVAQILLRRDRAKPAMRAWIFAICFWGYKGLETNFFYRFQAWLFGDDAHLTTVVAKLIMDMAVWCPIWAVPVTAYLYFWKESGFNRERLGQLWGWDGYRVFVLPTLVSNWLIWLPSVCFIYLLPLPLQVPLFNLVLFLFVLILTVVVRRPT